MALARILLTTLDMCEAMRPRDYDTPSAILESGSVFFREDVNGSRTYIEDDLRGHRLWHDQDFWNHSLRVAVHLQVKSGGKIPTDAGAGVSVAGTLIRLSCRVHVFSQCFARDANFCLSDEFVLTEEVMRGQREFVMDWMIGAIHKMMTCGTLRSALQTLPSSDRGACCYV